jgi:hypothetical protein
MYDIVVTKRKEEASHHAPAVVIGSNLSFRKSLRPQDVLGRLLGTQTWGEGELPGRVWRWGELGGKDWI